MNPIKLVVLGTCSFVALTAALGSCYIVDQTEYANVRRFGTVQYKEPVGPGLHFKLPFIDAADKLQVTLQTIHIPPFSVLTVDNQKVTIEENFNYTINKTQVYHVLYEVGSSGHISASDIAQQIVPVAHDRTASVFASQNMVTVNSEREKIQAQVEASVTQSVENLFGLTAHSLQITAIRPSEGFMASIDQATMAKNAAIAAENQLRTKQFEAMQVAATAKGTADAAIEQARGQAESVRLNAEANKGRLIAEGEGLKENLELQIKPFGTVDKYVDYLRAKATLNWTGTVPQVVSGTNGSSNIVIPLPMNNQPYRLQQ